MKVPLKSTHITYSRVHESRTLKSRILGYLEHNARSRFSPYVFFVLTSRSSRTRNTGISNKSTSHSQQRPGFYSLSGRREVFLCYCYSQNVVLVSPREAGGRGGWGVMLTSRMTGSPRVESYCGTRAVHMAKGAKNVNCFNVLFLAPMIFSLFLCIWGFHEHDELRKSRTLFPIPDEFEFPVFDCI